MPSQNLPLPGGEREQAAELIGGVHYPRVKVVLGGYGANEGAVASSNPLPIVGTVAISSMPTSGGGLTDDELRAADVKIMLDGEAVAISGTVPVSGTFWQATQPVSGPLTDAQLRVAAVPVSLASLPKAREDSAVMTWASLKSAAPSASAVQADTGQLAAGDYDFDINLAASDTVAVGKGLVIEHRNAANSATSHVLGGCEAPGSAQIKIRRYTIATNERIRVITGTAAGAASSMYVSAIGRRIA